MFEHIKEGFKKFFKTRVLVFIILMSILFVVLLQKLFDLQIINGESYLENYTLRIKKERVLESTRGNIYDRNGELLAYNELSYTIQIEDNGTYSSTKQKNAALNEELFSVLQVLDQNGDSIENNFAISIDENGILSFNVSGTSLLRFLADVYGHTDTDDLSYNNDLGYNEANATPEEVLAYLAGDKKFGVSLEAYGIYDYYRLIVLRYAMSQNSYQKYILTDIATNVSDESVAYVSENNSSLQGVTVKNDTIRKYVDSEYFCHIIGYTGKISQEEYDTYSAENDEYSLTDVVGKSGIEQVMDASLKGEKGYESVYVDNMGKVIETIETTDPVAGNDVYLSIDKNLQKVVYDLLEQEIASIVYSKIVNQKEYNASSESSASDIVIPIYDVYYALINNNIIDMTHFSADDASVTEKTVQAAYEAKETSVLNWIQSELSSANASAYEELTEEEQVYISYIVSMLGSNDILMSNNIDKTDDVYLAWKNDEISLTEYLNYAIENNWIDITKFDLGEKYSDSSEIYDTLLSYILDELRDDRQFKKKIYKYVIQQDLISGKQLCEILYDQGVLSKDDDLYASLESGNIGSYELLREKIKNIEITPAQLALDPCTGSCVITDPQSGELLACVSYPGYDNNKLANTVDAKYYASLQEDLSLPLYDYATQQQTAPGSTFKMVTAVAGMTEGVISPDTVINATGVYTNITPNPTCWIWNTNHSTHGEINVSQALRDSCNYFFYEVGFLLSNGYVNYNADLGISKIAKYAEEFGLGDNTGIEIPENAPQIATEYPVTAAIGQSNNNYTTTELARYITAVANRGTVYNYTLLKQVCDPDGNVIETYTPEVKNTMTDIADSTWDAVWEGNRMVVENTSEFNDFQIAVAGKTGTAQQVTSRPNHALFVCYAPYGSKAEVSVATRIAYGYSSHNAAAVTRDILSYYFGLNTEEELLSGQAQEVATSNSFAD